MIEGLIKAVSPTWAFRREQARVRIAAIQKQAELIRSYDAAKQGGSRAGWFRPSTSANAEIREALTLLRSGGRELVRNNPHASRSVRILSAQIAGRGVRPRPINENEDVKRIAKDQWERFVENCDPEGRMDFYAQQRLLIRSVVECGEALRIWSPVVEDGAKRWRCKVVEGDFLDHTREGLLSNGNRTYQGIEYDALGRRVAYWLFDEHPGENFLNIDQHESRRVSADLVDHIFEPLRAGQRRGVSWFSPVALTIHDTGDLAEAELVRKKLEACIAGVITTDDFGAEADPGVAFQAKEDEDTGGIVRDTAGNAIERMSPGMFLRASPGWDMKFHAPPPSEGLVEHMKERLHAIAAGIGITYHQMTGDLAEANYSSMRGGLIDFRAMLDGWQDDLMVMQSGRPAWARVMDAARRNRLLRFPVRATWTPPGRPWVDPAKDLEAKITSVSAGFESPQDVIAQGGADPEETLAELRQWRDATQDLALTVTYREPVNDDPEPEDGAASDEGSTGSDG